LLCLVRPAPRLPARSSSARRGGAASITFHIAAAAIVISLTAWSRPLPRHASTTTESAQVPRLVFLLQPGIGGGGGGGGGREPEPPSRARAAGSDRLTVPVVKRVQIQPSLSAPVARQEVLLDAKPLAQGTEFLTGVPEASASLPFSRGPGYGEGVGEGTGSGIGSGTGPGMGAGSGGGFGGGAYRLGSGVTPPTLLKQVTPKYTADAMRQRIQGLVALEVVISREGIPIAIRVTRSLDPGLDSEAMAAARQWRFIPGKLGDTPVDVVVTILLDFNVR
jgi:protein TonB